MKQEYDQESSALHAKEGEGNEIYYIDIHRGPLNVAWNQR